MDGNTGGYFYATGKTTVATGSTSSPTGSTSSPTGGTPRPTPTTPPANVTPNPSPYDPPTPNPDPVVDTPKGPVWDVYFVEISKTTVGGGNGGELSAEGYFEIPAGEECYVEFYPNDGYRVMNVVVDGVSKGAVNYYWFSGVNNDHTIVVTFVRAISISLDIDIVSGGNVSDDGYIKSGYGIPLNIDFAGSSALVIDSITATNTATHKTYNLQNISGSKWSLPANSSSKTGARVDYIPVSTADGEYQWQIEIKYHNADDTTDSGTLRQAAPYIVQGNMYEDDFTGSGK